MHICEQHHRVWFDAALDEMLTKQRFDEHDDGLRKECVTCG